MSSIVPAPFRGDALAARLADGDQALSDVGRTLRSMTRIEALAAHQPGDAEVCEEIAARIIANIPSLAGRLQPAALVAAVQAVVARHLEENAR